MFALRTTEQCGQSEDICNQVYDWTGNQTTANLADWLIGNPLAIGFLVVLALVLRFVFHRLVDRLVSQAEDGVLPARMSRFSRRQQPPQTGRSAAAYDLATQTRRVQRAKTMGDLLKSVITGVL